MPSWLIWLIAAGALAAGEALSLDLVLITLAGGAGAGAITAAIGAPPAIQVLVAALVAFGLLLGVRPVARRHLMGHGAVRMGADALVGMKAQVMSEVDGRDGRIKLNGAEWSARALDPSQHIPPGATVRVMEISGATAVVWEDLS
jgi:membrane protein implicated in regulation of membrane protease activity